MRRRRPPFGNCAVFVFRTSCGVLPASPIQGHKSHARGLIVQPGCPASRFSGKLPESEFHARTDHRSIGVFTGPAITAMLTDESRGQFRVSTFFRPASAKKASKEDGRACLTRECVYRAGVELPDVPKRKTELFFYAPQTRGFLKTTAIRASVRVGPQ